MVDKSKTQLIAELAATHQQIAKLEVARSEIESVENALRESEEHFRIALQNSNIVVYNQDRDLRYTWIYNPLLGFTSEGIIGKTDAELLLSEDAAPLEEMKRRVLETGTGTRETVRTIIDGEAYFYDLTVEPLCDAEGNVIGVTGASRDITERVRADRALGESEEKYRTLFETMAQGVVYQAANGEITLANPAAERILGLTLDQMQGRTSMDPRWRAIHEEGTDFPGDTHPSMVALRTGEPVKNVVMGVFDPQREDHVWINVNATPQFRPGEDTPYQVYTTFDDITWRWLAEKALQTERDRAQGYLDIAGLIIVIDPDQTISLINRNGCKTLAYEEQELLGRNWFDTCVPERERERVRSVFSHLMRGDVEPVEYFENVVLTKGGRERIIAWHNTVLRDEAGAIVGALSSGEDITERKQVESARDATLAALRERTHELGERVKELNCLYGLSRLRERPGVSLEEIYQGTAELIPPAWQHPEITGARVAVDGHEYCTENFREDAPCQQAAEIIVYGQVCGIVRVCYCEDGPESDEGPFLAEERNLLNAIAGRLGRITEHKRAEEESRIAREDLELRVEERTAELKRGHQRERVLNTLLRLSMEDIPLKEQLERALDEILSIPWLPVQPQGAIFLVGDDAPSGAGTLELHAQRGFDQDSQAACKRVSFGQCLCGRAASSRNLLFAEHGDERHEIHHEGLAPHDHYCVPILSGDRPIGTIALYLERGHSRDVQQEEFLQAVSDTLAGIIERKRVEDALRRSEAGLAEAQRIARLGNWDWDIEANELHWSDEIYRIFGLAPQEFGTTYEAFLNSVHPDDRSLVERSVNEALYGRKPYSIDHRIVLPDGSERTVHEQAEITYAQSGQPLRMVGTVQDVTDRKQAEVAVLEERGRLARDLHDSVTQSLYSITLLAEGWKRLDRAGRLGDSEDPLTELGEIAQQALKEMRLMVHELRPPDLEGVGLLGALHQRLGAVEKRAGIDARLVADDVVELSPRIEECLYRIALEALNNALKHAGATSVEVRVRMDGDKVELEVMDDGCGFDVEALDARRGMGLQGMRERAEQLGGVFLVGSTPSEGTRVSVSIDTRGSA